MRQGLLFWDRASGAIRRNDTGDIIARTVRRNGRYIWRAEDPGVQAVLNEWAKGSTIGGLMCVLEDYIREKVR